ncbi:MAG: TonB-dependent receptor [Acidobacteriaceae bacterium]|nr:TonB-dependent receptor [Acidobacteriaceae bacterium]
MLRCTLVVGLCLIALAGWGQEFRATITGRVTDPQNAIVPGVRITAVQTETGAKSDTVSDSQGQYTIPFLPPGMYTISAEAPGFKRYEREKFNVSSGERIGLDIKLELGQTSETVNVTAEAPLLETATASTGQVISSRQVANMPMNGRTPLVLAQMATGVNVTADPKFARPFDNSGPSGMSMGGAPAQSNELLVDGSPDTTGNLRVAYNPPVDAVDEIRVHAFEADAAYGHTGGGTVNVVLKGGSNDLHGTAYEFNQTSALAATPFFTNKAGLTKPVTRYNQWGVNSGGPILIPKVFNGRNRVFWFFAYEGIKDSFPEPITTTVPTVAERNGDFSALLRLGANYRIYDPNTGVLSGSKVVRTAFTNNIIPANRLNPIAKAYLQFYPLANQAGGPDGRNNYLANSVRSDTFDSELGRLDFNLGDKNKLFWNFRHNDRVENRGNLFNNIATGNFLGRANWGTLADDVYTLNATTVMNVRLNWTRFIESDVRPSNGFNATSLGLPSYIAAQSPQLVLPKIDFATCGDHNNFECLGDSGGDRTPFDIFQIFADVVKIAGKHSVKFGADLRLERESSISYGNSEGLYQFRTDWTKADTSATSAPLGQDFAAFMLGLPSNGGGFDLNSYRTGQEKYYALFIQDDWRARPNLTLNLGLRFEQDLPITERYNRATNGFDTTDPNPISAAALAAYAADYAKIPSSYPIPPGQFRTPGGLLFTSPGNRDVYQTRSHYFSPRFGFSWSPTALHGKTVLRGGTGIFLVPLGVQSLSGTSYVNQTGFSQSTSVVSTLNSYLTPHATLTNPFTDGILQPTGSSLGLATYLGRTFDFMNPYPLNPYSLRWEFGLQHQLGKSMVFEAAYIGNHAVHLPVDKTNINYTPAQYLSKLPYRDQPTIDYLSAVVANPFLNLLPGTSLNGSTVARSQLLKPFPEFGDPINMRQDSAGESYYHSLDVRFEKRYSQGLVFWTNYTFSKLIEKRTRLNDSDIYLLKRISPDDRPQRVVVSGSYELPFGRGKRFSFNNSGLWNRVAGGWVVNGIYNWEIGGPVGDWGNVIYYGGDLHFNPRGVDGAFDITRFNTISSQQLSSNIRTFPNRFGNLRVDSTNNLDASVLKNTAITERTKLELRFEVFNALNHAVFSGPDLSATSSTFGKITNQNNLSRVVQMGARFVW